MVAVRITRAATGATSTEYPATTQSTVPDGER